MVRHYGCPNITCNDSLPSLYPRTLGMYLITNNLLNIWLLRYSAPLWSFSSWVPQAVVINLGTNDYGTQPYPPTEVFVAGMNKWMNACIQYYTVSNIHFMLGYTAFVQNQVVSVYGKNVTVFAVSSDKIMFLDWSMIWWMLVMFLCGEYV